MSSFYGGKRGASLEIKQSYADYNAMIQDQDNIDYNEYVITTSIFPDLYLQLYDIYGFNPYSFGPFVLIVPSAFAIF